MGIESLTCNGIFIGTTAGAFGLGYYGGIGFQVQRYYHPEQQTAQLNNLAKTLTVATGAVCALGGCAIAAGINNPQVGQAIHNTMQAVIDFAKTPGTVQMMLPFAAPAISFAAGAGIGLYRGAHH